MYKGEININIYHKWGFLETPFETKPLPPDDSGITLLIGRGKEIEKINRRLSSSEHILTVEGLNGVGKTSLIQIAVYRAYKQYIESAEQPFFIPCYKSFQLDPDQDVEEFIDEVLWAVAQTLISRGEELKKRGYELKKIEKIESWLNYPRLDGFSASASVLGCGVGGGKTGQINTTAGYLRSGFRKTVLDWLLKIFKYGENGGVVCIIDNLELLQTSDSARKKLEQLRDKLFSYSGIRCVLCGSLGIVSGILSSPRLEGRLDTPIIVKGIDCKYASEILNSRIKAFSSKESYLPIRIEEFEKLYRILNFNIRNVLDYSHKYCLWVVDEDRIPKNDKEKGSRFYEWLDYMSRNLINEIKAQIGKRSLETFIRAIELGGSFSLADYAEFNYKDVNGLRPHINAMEKYGMLTRYIAEDDKRRKTINITAKGWFLNYALTNVKKGS